jgi:hypothetical protein
MISLCCPLVIQCVCNLYIQRLIFVQREAPLCRPFGRYVATCPFGA